MTMPETLPAPADDHTPILGAESFKYACPRCGHVLFDTKLAAGPNVFDLGARCPGCAFDFRGAKVVVELDPATPAKLAALAADRESGNRATERANVRRERGEPLYPPMVLCGLCRMLATTAAVDEPNKTPEDVLPRRHDFDIDRDHCSSCAAPLADTDPPPPLEAA